MKFTTKTFLLAIGTLFHMSQTFSYMSPDPQGDMYRKLLKHFNKIFHSQSKIPDPSIQQKITTVHQPDIQEHPNLSSINLNKLLNAKARVDRAKVLALLNRKHAINVNSRFDNRVVGRKACDGCHEAELTNLVKNIAVNRVNESISQNHASPIYFNHQYGSNFDLNEEIGSPVNRDKIGKGRGKTHTRTKIFVNKAANIVQHSKNKSTDKVFTISDGDGLNIINEKDTDFQEALNSFNFNTRTLKKSEIIGNIVTQKVEHVDRRNSGRNYKEIIIDRNMDENNDDSKVSENEVRVQELIKDGIESQFNARNFSNTPDSVSTIDGHKFDAMPSGLMFSNGNQIHQPIVENRESEIHEIHVYHPPIEVQMPIQMIHPNVSHYQQVQYHPVLQPQQTFVNHITSPGIHYNNIADSHHTMYEEMPLIHQGINHIGVQNDSAQNFAFGHDFDIELAHHDGNPVHDNSNNDVYNNSQDLIISGLNSGLHGITDGVKMLSTVLHDSHDHINQISDHNQNYNELEGVLNGQFLHPDSTHTTMIGTPLMIHHIDDNNNSQHEFLTESSNYDQIPEELINAAFNPTHIQTDAYQPDQYDHIAAYQINPINTGDQLNNEVLKELANQNLSPDDQIDQALTFDVNGLNINSDIGDNDSLIQNQNPNSQTVFESPDIHQLLQQHDYLQPHHAVTETLLPGVDADQLVQAVDQIDGSELAGFAVQSLQQDPIVQVDNGVIVDNDGSGMNGNAIDLAQAEPLLQNIHNGIIQDNESEGFGYEQPDNMQYEGMISPSEMSGGFMGQAVIGNNREPEFMNLNEERKLKRNGNIASFKPVTGITISSEDINSGNRILLDRTSDKHSNDSYGRDETALAVRSSIRP